VSDRAPPKGTPPRKKARQLAKHLRTERPDYAYLNDVLRQLRVELAVEVRRTPNKLPSVPTEDELRRWYESVWQTRRGPDIVLVKTLLYTGVRVAKLVALRLGDVDLDNCRIRIENGKGARTASCRSRRRSSIHRPMVPRRAREEAPQPISTLVLATVAQVRSGRSHGAERGAAAAVAAR
jgi:integrase